jgi:hypothetical protein
MPHQGQFGNNFEQSFEKNQFFQKGQTNNEEQFQNKN